MVTSTQAVYEYFVEHRSGSLTAGNPLDTGVVRDFVMNTQEVVYGQTHQVLVNQIWDPPLVVNISVNAGDPPITLTHWIINENLLPDGSLKPLYVEILAEISSSQGGAITATLHFVTLTFGATPFVAARQDQGRLSLDSTVPATKWQNIPNSDPSLDATSALAIYPTRILRAGPVRRPIRNDFNETRVTNHELPLKTAHLVMSDFVGFDDKDQNSLILYGIFVREVDFSWL